MAYEVEKPSTTRVTVTVRVPYAELEPFLKPAAEKISAEVEIEGFRKGKASYEVIKQKFGEFKILEEAARFYIQKNVETILDEIKSKEYQGRNFEPLGEPQAAITKLAWGQELEFKITLSLLPEIELPDYKALAKEVLAGKEIPEVMEKEVESSLNWLRESRAKLITVNRAAGIGDRVEIDFSASLAGVKIEGGESKNHPFILGRNSSLVGFMDKLLGMKAGEEKTFNLEVPPDYADKKIAGKALQFKVEMKLVQKREVPELNDEFAKSLGNFSSVQELEKSVREGLTIKQEIREKERIRMAMLEAISAQTRTEMPELLIESEFEKMMTELEENVKALGLKFEDYLNRIKKTPSDLKKEWRGDAERRVKIALVLREIAKKENINPTEEEVQETVNRTAEHRGLNGASLKNLDSQAFLDYNRGIARNDKVLQFLENLEMKS